MEKEALLKIILRDIKELELLVNTFLGDEQISEGYIQLAKNKTQAILDELDLVAQTSSKKVAPITEKDSAKKEEPVSQPLKKEKSEAKKTSEKEPVVHTAKTVEVIEPKEEKPQEAISQPAIAPESKKETKPKNAVLGEVLRKENKSLNEQLHAQQTSSEFSFQSPISDLKKAIGINDRFLFQRELFNNNSELYSQVVDQINELTNYDSALSFIKTNFDWDFENSTTEVFIELVKRRFKSK